MPQSLADKAAAFRALHRRGNTFVMPNDLVNCHRIVRGITHVGFLVYLFIQKSTESPAHRPSVRFASG